MGINLTQSDIHSALQYISCCCFCFVALGVVVGGSSVVVIKVVVIGILVVYSFVVVRCRFVLMLLRHKEQKRLTNAKT